MTTESKNAALTDAVSTWAAALDAAVTANDRDALAELLLPDGYWRDVIALTWELGWVQGADTVAERFLASANNVGAADFTVSTHYSAPKRVVRGVEVTEAFLDFSTRYGRGVAIVRLVDDPSGSGGIRARTVVTALQEVHGSELAAPPGRRRPGTGFDRSDTKRNWADRRAEEIGYEQHDPDVLIVGAGHSGAFLGAHLRQLGVDTLIVDRLPRAGDNWRVRYHSLVLHNPADAVQFPFMPYPTTFPEYLPKDVIGNWIEAFFANMELNFWGGTEFVGGSYDEASKSWTVTLRKADGTERHLHPKHLVLATGGEGGTPSMPDLAGLESFAGDVRHSKHFTSGADYAGKDVLVVGISTSAHDVALDLHNYGARPTMLQRQPAVVVSLDSANLPFSYYTDGTLLEEADLLGVGNFIYPLFVEGLQALQRRTNELDQELHVGLQRAGMSTGDGEENAGWLLKFFRYRGGYYINVGASDKIIDGSIKVLQSASLDQVVPEGVRLTDGEVRKFDAIVCATGYGNVQEEVRTYLGDEIAERVGEIGGFDEGYELRNLYRRTAQEGLWIFGGGIPTARSYSRYLAIQIRAALEGWLPVLTTETRK